MRFFTFSLIVVAAVSTLGCSTENPLCTDNFCVEGEIYPRSDLPRGAEFSELAIDDSAVLATLAGTPPVRAEPIANFISAIPPGGSIAHNASITVTFDNEPTDVTVSAGTVIVSGKVAIITGPFTPGPLALMITWADGSQALNYAVIIPDTDPPLITGGTVRDGETNVDPKDINAGGQIVVEFSEDVFGNIALQTGDGDDIGWLGRVEGNKAILEVVRGKEIGNEKTYVIKGKVSDAAGNSTDVSITFVTEDEE